MCKSLQISKFACDNLLLGSGYSHNDLLSSMFQALFIATNSSANY